MSIECDLERGFCWYYEQQSEFERRDMPIEKQVALGFEAGYQTGKAETITKIIQTLKHPGGEWP